MPRPMAELILSDDERQTLKTWASRPRSTLRLATRARIVLACAEGADNKAVARSIVTGERVGERWIIQQGLKPGDRVVIEGLQKARPGSVVNPQPYQPGPQGH